MPVVRTGFGDHRISSLPPNDVICYASWHSVIAVDLGSASLGCTRVGGYPRQSESREWIHLWQPPHHNQQTCIMSMGYRHIVKALLRDHFAARTVDSFAIQESPGWDEDHFIKVTIVLDEDVAHFDVKKAADFRRALREKLNTFPIVSFVSKAERSRAA